jgi:hypothetical protein
MRPGSSDQVAGDLRQLDRTTSFEDVGVMAALPRSAFVPGRYVNIYRQLRSDSVATECIQRFGVIEWSGDE